MRRELLNNGLRAGVIGSSVPAAITLRRHQEKPKPMDSQAAVLDKNDELMSDPPVHGHVVRLRRNQRSEIQASEIYPSPPLLVSRGTELTGHTYEQRKPFTPCVSTRAPTEPFVSSYAGAAVWRTKISLYQRRGPVPAAGSLATKKYSIS